MKRHRGKMYGALLVLLLSANVASSASAVTFDWAVIGNAGNPADDAAGYCGSVGYEYSIATTEVTTAQYVEFLNAVASEEDIHYLYNSLMSTYYYYSGISRTDSSGSYEYSANTGWENRPVVFVSWYDTLRFANWLNNGQLTGVAGAASTEYGAYDMSLQSTDPSSIVRLAGANYWLPSENEWYKAAYYDPNKGGLGIGGYWDYATGSDSLPSATTPEGDTGNSANYYDGRGYIDTTYFSTEVGAYDESESPYGTYDQSGNVHEWTETLFADGIYSVCGGAWGDSTAAMHATGRNYSNVPTYEDFLIGFRIASDYTGDGGSSAIPEPMSIGLLVTGLIGLVYRKRNKA